MRPGSRASRSLTFARYGIATVVLVFALVLVHKWLPFGRRRLADIAPGILVTLVRLDRRWAPHSAAISRSSPAPTSRPMRGSPPR